MTFDATRTYQADLDVRDWNKWRERLRGEPEGVLWSLIGPRRSGKTWALRALESRDTTYVNLQADANGLRKSPQRGCILVDEPGRLLRRERSSFVERCAELRRENIRILIAMTPGEWEYPAELDPEEQHVKARDRLALPLLSHEQALKLARTEWASQLLEQLPIDWRRNPFLLELVFETAEANTSLRQRVDKLIQATIHSSANERFRYVQSVFEEGLSEGQKTDIRRIARGQTDFREQILLGECGLVGDGPRITDPILQDHLRLPLIVHHISDVHFGHKSAAAVDRKEGGEHGRRIALAAANVTVRDDYIAHLQVQGANAPHAVLVSGDLVETGTADQYEAARAFLDQLSHLLVEHPDLRPNDRRVAIVGGNHDVDWNETRGPAGARKRHLAFARHMEGFPHPHLETAPEKRALSTIVWPGVGVELVLLGSAECGGEEDEIQSQIVPFIDSLVSRGREALEANQLKRFESITMQLSRIDPGLVHHLDLKRLEAHKWTQPVRLAMLHHPVSPMPVPTEVARFGGLINAGAVKTALLRSGVCLVLHGHQHSGWFSRESWPGRYDARELRVAAAPTLGSREVLENLGFNEIRIYREGAARYEVEVRRVAYNGNGWDYTNNMMSFTLNGAGIAW